MSFLTDRPVLLGTSLLASASASVTFSNIPSSINNLVCHYTTKSTGGQPTYDLLGIRFNGSSVAAYYSTQDPSLNTEGRIAIIPPSGIFPTGQHGAGTFHIYDIQNTARPKVASALYINQYSTTVRNLNAAFYGAVWENNAAISSVTFLGVIATLEAGTQFKLYGYP